MPHYDYHRPTSLAEVWQLAKATPDALLVAGGTDLFVQMRKRRVPEPPALISLRNVAELGAVTAGDTFRIGATAALTDVAAHPAVREVFPALVESIDVLGSPQIRNVATLGGNLCNASPAADTAPALMVYGARVEIASEQGAREVPIEDFFQGPGRCAVVTGELVTAVLIDTPAPTARAAFLRKGRIKLDLAIASVAALVELDGGVCTVARVAAGAVAPTPLRLTEVERALEGATLDDEVIAKARALASAAISPITDLRSTEQYRRDLVGVYVARALRSVRAPEQA